MRSTHARPLPLALLSLPALALALLGALAGPVASSHAATASMTNGCAVSARGIPSCGAFVGAAYGSNADVASWEKSMGKKLGVHRTYWSAGGVSGAVRTATNDAANHRIPWLSFKAPHSWSQMAAGAGDAWARDLATQMRSVGGPVWVAVDHEPENEGGDIQQWKAMQAHLAPIMRAAAPNLGYSIILMGYHEFHGAAKFKMSAIWPRTTIDIAGFDIYEEYGVKGRTKWKQWTPDYFDPIQSWSKSTGVPWGLAETGYGDTAAAQKPGWMKTVYDQLVAHGGKAFSYFNTNLHSATDWRLHTASKQKAFTSLSSSAPTLR